MRIVSAVAMVLVAACVNDGAREIAVTASVSPTPGATEVSRAAAITVNTNVVMDTAYCRGRMMLHLGDSTGPIVATGLMSTSDQTGVVLTPDSTLAPHTTYFVHVRNLMMTRHGMMDGGSMMSGGGMMTGGHRLLMQAPTGGVPMSDGMGWSFTTGD